MTDIPCARPLSAHMYAFGGPVARARVRTFPEDFQVDEILGFEPDGEGGHALLQVRKRGENTEWVARTLARLAGVHPGEVGYSGLKDRDAVTTQWFSINLQGVAEPDWAVPAGAGIEILAVHRHRRKLRRGTHRYNRFALRLRDVQGDTADVARRLERISRDGVPNYFAEQRFGRDEGNVPVAYAMLTGARPVRDRHRRGLYLSAARALLFNRLLSARVQDGTWRRAVPGDVMMLDGSHSIFRLEAVDAAITERVAQGDVHPTGPLWGRGEPGTGGVAGAVEEAVLAPCLVWRQGLEAAGLRHERRSLRLPVPDLSWEFVPDGDLRLGFTLPAGSYATAVLRELVR